MHLDTEKLIIDRRKITDYLLNSNHPDGRSKCNFFLSVGFEINNPDQLLEALEAHPEVNAVLKTVTTPHGKKHVVECYFKNPNNANYCIRTIWLEKNKDEILFVTAYPNPSRN
ncbi:DUF6883 domain-containing protein [Rhodovarius lipocyclicus]|uniref:DUF6883 domain-containing protein n=1 Tax=Rhodovarius lipocyclicus TaxID=268410 RepID=UPI001356A11A|nr:DUF6883 domain-containing protein [Rhodovarius lipocyclicus]